MPHYLELEKVLGKMEHTFFNFYKYLRRTNTPND